MRKILSLVLGLLWALPVWGADCITDSDNIFLSDGATVGFYSQDGSYTDQHANMMTTDFLNIPDSAVTLTYSFDGESMAAPCIVFFDNAQQPIYFYPMRSQSTVSITIPDETKYVKIPYRTTFTTQTVTYTYDMCLGKNLLDNSTFVYGYHYDGQGILYQYNGRTATQKFSVKDIDTISIKFSTSKPNVQTAFCAWNENGQMVERKTTSLGQGIKEGTYDVSSYDEVAFFFWNLDNSVGAEGDITNVMVVEGSVPQDYVPYKAPIKIATTKYNESAFGPLNTALANAISVVDSVVSNTITQAGRIATLQTQKQTRPNDIADDNEKCPAGKKCLLVTDTAGVPHWYEIVENASLLPNGYTELQYITFNGTQELDTGFTPNQDTRIESKIYGATNANMWIYGTGISNPRITAYLASSGNQRFGNKTVDSTGITGETLITIVQDKNVFNWNGNTKTYDSQSNFTALTSLTIGNSNGSTGTPYFSGNFYYMKIYDNEILVRDYVPAQDSNNNVGLFDRVNNVFLTAEGLVAGAIVE